MTNLEITLEELYTIIGELEVVKRKLTMGNQKLLIQIDEMSQEITRLREENGRLVKADDNE